MNEKLSFACDYAKGAHPNIMKLRSWLQTYLRNPLGYIN